MVLVDPDTAASWPSLEYRRIHVMLEPEAIPTVCVTAPDHRQVVERTAGGRGGREPTTVPFELRDDLRLRA